MNLLIDPLPQTILVDGAEYPLYTDFRAVLRYDALLKEEGEENFLKCLSCLLPRLPGNLEETIAEIGWFVSCGREERRRRPSNKLLGINSNTPFDFAVDAERIFSAFRRNDVYGIDLLEIEYLHWWTFMAMLDDLPETVALSRIMGYRTLDLTNKDIPKERKPYYTAMQNYHKIRARKEARNEELIKALKEGRDPAPYL